MAAAALDHPYICKIFEIGSHNDSLFLVMECVVGTTLHQRLLEGRMPLADARGFLYRGLKPAKVMLTGQGHVKVMDFGN